MVTDRPRASPEQHRCGLGRGQHRLGLDPAFELLMEPLDRVGGVCALPLTAGQSDKGEEAVTGFLRPPPCIERPFADEGSQALLDLRGRGGVDYVCIVGRDLFMQPIERVGRLVSVLMDRAALGRPVAPEGSQRLLEPGRTTVPFRIKRMIASSASGRTFQVSQSAFTFRRTQLTVS